MSFHFLNVKYFFSLPQFFLLFAKCLIKPLFKTSSGHAPDGRGNHSSTARRSCMSLRPICLIQKRYWPMEPFRRVRSGHTISGIQNRSRHRQVSLLAGGCYTSSICHLKSAIYHCPLKHVCASVSPILSISKVTACSFTISLPDHTDCPGLTERVSPMRSI